jgi:type VI secretion system secreted protein VgrG
MNVGIDINASLATSMTTGLFPGPPGAGSGHPFELRAGPWFGGELQVISLRGRERINDVYRYDITFATDQPPELVTSALFGMPACLTMKSPGNDPRVIQGLAVSIEALGGVAGEQGSKRRRFSLSIVPRLWLLKHRRQNRIFQNKTVPEIVKAILAAVDIHDLDCNWRANKPAYPPLPFVYQRGETDWDFFRRILASAGIFFFYEHASGFLDSLFGGAASAVAGAVGAAAGMLGGAVASTVSTVESATGMVPVLNFGDAAGHTAAVASGLGGVAADALQAGLGALGGAIGGAAGAAVSAVAGVVEEPSDTIAFDDDQGADADVDRVYEFTLKKELRTKELRMLDRDVEAARSWVGVASVGDVSASLNLSAGVSLSAGLSLSGGMAGGGMTAATAAMAGSLSVAAGLGTGFDMDAPTIPAAMLRQEIYQEDLAVWQDAAGPNAPPAVALSASLIAGGVTAAATAQAGAFSQQATATAQRLRMELERTRRKYQEARGQSDCRRMGAGYRFTLGAHPIKMVNGEYTVTALDVVGVHPDFLADGQAVYRNRFRCVPSHVAPRPKRPARRPKPGMEVARVVGFIGGDTVPGLEANQAGYVHVRFRWDIVDDDYAMPRGSLEIGATPTDDVYSVWLPVVQPWAGNGYGTQFIPREGMEVLVGFMDDQSERPVILGCLYSDENRPPWNEYIEHQKVGIRSQTRPGNGYSEVSIDDRQGREVVKIRAQRDLDVDVLHDARLLVQADARVRVHGGATVDIDGDFTTKVDATHQTDVAGGMVLHVEGGHTVTIGDGATRTVGSSETTVITGSQRTTIGGDAGCDVRGTLTDTIGSDLTTSVGRRHAVTVGTVGSEHAESDSYVWGTCRIGAQDTITIESEKAVVLRCGKSELRLTPESIEILGKTVKAHAAQQLQLAGNGPSLDLADELHVMSKKMTLQSSGARISLGDSAVVQSSSVQLGKPNQATLPPDTPTPAPTPPLSITLLHTDHTPLANCHFQLELGGTTLEGTTNGAGGITVSSPPPELKNGRCTVWTGDFPIGPRLVLDITFDTIEPAADITGAQKRLRNLGYLRAAPTGIFDTPTMDAVLIFQQTHDLELTGELDGPTTAKLSEIHP